jgi:putative transposase
VGVAGDGPACSRCKRACSASPAAGWAFGAPAVPGLGDLHEAVDLDLRRHALRRLPAGRGHHDHGPRHRKWICEVVSGEETSTQIQVAFCDALQLEGLHELVAERQDSLALDDAVRRPILLAVSDNGPQMTSGSTREFMAMCAIAQHFGRPGTPTDQAWIESLFSHIKADWPHLDKVADPAVLRAELAVVRVEYNTVRLHAGIGYVTPDDEHEGRGPRIRRARRVGLMRARRQRIAYHRLQHRQSQPPESR